MYIPDKFEKILKTDRALRGLVDSIVTSFEPLFKDNKLFFFEEYTDHGVEHIEMVLKAAEFLIPDESFQYLQPKEVAILILAVVLHDIGMHAEFSTFKAMIDGKYDDVRVDVLDKKTWKELWSDYLSEVRHWSSKKLEDIFGNSAEIPQTPDLSDKDKLTGTDKKLIGEFIRRHHARLSHEIALNGFIGNDTIIFGNSEMDERYKQLAGIIARSHGINIRDTFSYLEKIAQDAWKYPDGLNVVFLMILLRIADYLQIDKTRTNEVLLKVKTFNSPVSLREHKAHLSIRHIDFGKLKEPELIYVECNKPKNARMYVKLQNLIKDIQHELDISWAILGETYGFLPSEKPKVKFRRITSNLEHPAFLEQINYVPQKISFEVNNELSKLLVAPLYGDNPTYGVRELVQNATDACKERMKIEQDKGNIEYIPLVTVSIDKIDEKKYLFKIQDNGKGMTLDEILNYFLSVGSSFRKSLQWKQEFTSADGKSLVNRNGKFGIGILAAFLLGNEISVKTKSNKDNSKAFAFIANMNSDFIDIETTTGFEIGTAIEITLDKNKFDRLTSLNSYDKIHWTDWYIGKSPEIQYLLNDETKVSKHFFEQSKERAIFPKDYDKVQWDYSREIKGSRDMFVACNDIVVTLENENKFAYNYSDVITIRPHILIEDSQGNLPLSLNRNRLDSYLLPFEEELYEDIACDFIARLLMYPISSEVIKKDSIFPHNADFLYLANGFSLAVNYFIGKLQNKTLLRILTRDSSVIKNSSLILSRYPNLIIFPLFSQLYNLRGQGDKVAPNVNSHILLKKQRYQAYFEEERRIQKSLINKHKTQWENDKYVAYTMNSYQSQLSLFDENEFGKIIDLLDKNIQSIQEIPLSYLQIKKGGTILNQLFEKYIDNNVIIPYDMEERKKLYPLAFEELKEYMKDYE
jgi:hypothetical protein